MKNIKLFIAGIALTSIASIAVAGGTIITNGGSGPVMPVEPCRCPETFLPAPIKIKILKNKTPIQKQRIDKAVRPKIVDIKKP